MAHVSSTPLKVACCLCGGLGNQLFQACTTLAYAWANQMDACLVPPLPLPRAATATRRNTYWSTLLRRLRPYVRPVPLSELRTFRVWKEPCFAYRPLPLPLPPTQTQAQPPRSETNANAPLLLSGYFQSPRYFHAYRPAIIELLQLGAQQAAYAHRLPACAEGRPVVAMHIRLGDYLQLPHVYPLLPVAYYQRAIEEVMDGADNEGLCILYHCEPESLDQAAQSIVEPLRRLFPQHRFVGLGSDLEDWEQLLVISQADHHILANSTFSWWGAYLNDRPHKRVCFPDPWFQPETGHDTQYLCPEDWTRVRW